MYQMDVNGVDNHDRRCAKVGRRIVDKMDVNVIEENRMGNVSNGC